MSKVFKPDDMTTPPRPVQFAPRHEQSHSSEHATRVLQSAQLLRAAEKKAEQMVDQARQQADAILQEAKVEAESIREQAKKEGYDIGYDTGWQEGMQQSEHRAQREVAEQIHTLQTAYRELKELRRDILAQSEEDLIKFAVLIAEKIVRTKLTSSQTTLNIAQTILAELKDESEVTLYLPPNVLPEDNAAKQLHNAQTSGMQLTIKTDEALQMGDVRIETKWGWIDGQAPVRWRRLIEALKRGVPSHEA